MKNTLLRVLFLAVFIISPFILHYAGAQPPLPDPDPIPIDGGISFLIIAGATYGASKIYKEHKKEKE